MLSASLVGFGRRADRSACHWAVVARYSNPPLRVAALRLSSREIVEADRPRRRPISCMEWPCTLRSAISSRSPNDRYRPESGFAENLNIAGGIPPAFRNNLVPTGCDTPASSAASSLLSPAAIPRQNLLCSSRPATGGRPGDGNGARPDRADRRFRMLIATSNFRVLRRPLESAQYALAEYRKMMQSAGFRASMSRRADCYDNAPMESFFHTLKTELVHHIREAVAYGNGRDFVAVMINIDLSAVGDWAERNNVIYASYQELAGLPQVYLLFALIMTMAGRFPEIAHMMPAWLYDAFNPNNKTNLAPYHLVHFIVLAFFITRFLPRDWRGLEWPIFRPLIKCGQQSLEVFCVGVFLAVGAHVVLVEVSDAIWMQIAVSVVGIILLTAVAYYRSWSKNAEKAKSPALTTPKISG
jgi:hypothetical protein